MLRVVIAILLLFNTKVSAQKTVIPDPFFEQALIYLNIDDSLDGTVLTENVSSLTELDLSIYGKITDLTGIQDFISLEILNCENHALTFLNLSSNLELRILNCDGNQLSQLDLSGNINLTHVTCKSNQINSLDISANKNLIELLCYDNYLMLLNTAGADKLVTLIAKWNYLEELDISLNKDLVNFNCERNDDLNCIQVNQAQLNGLNSHDFRYISFYVNHDVHYSLNCGVLGVDNLDILKPDIFPNPVVDFLYFENRSGEVLVRVYNSIGQEILSKKASNKVDMHELQKGIYLVKINDGNRSFTKRVLKI